MSIALAVYLASTLDIIKGIMLFVSIFAGGAALILLIIGMMDGEFDETQKKMLKSPFIVLLVTLPLAILTPSSEVVYIYTAEKVIENPVVQEEAADLYKDLKVIIHNLATKKD